MRTVAARRSAPPVSMPQEPIQARRFTKAREARSATLLEDYAELIADLMATGGEARTMDIARRMGVAHATAVKTVARLKREGLVIARPLPGHFSDRGRPSAGSRAPGLKRPWPG